MPDKFTKFVILSSIVYIFFLFNDCQSINNHIQDKFLEGNPGTVFSNEIVWPNRECRRTKCSECAIGASLRLEALDVGRIFLDRRSTFEPLALPSPQQSFLVSDVSSRTVQLHDILLNLETTEDSLTIVYLCKRFFLVLPKFLYYETV